MKRAVALAVLAGCAASPMLVADVGVSGHSLAVKRCPVRGIGSCTVDYLALPLVTARPPDLRARPTPDRDDAYRLIGLARAAVIACATERGVSGDLPVRLTMDERGHVTAADAAGFPEVGACVGTALASIVLPVRQLEVKAVLP